MDTISWKGRQALITLHEKSLGGVSTSRPFIPSSYCWSSLKPVVPYACAIMSRLFRWGWRDTIPWILPSEIQCLFDLAHDFSVVPCRVEEFWAWLNRHSFSPYEYECCPFLHEDMIPVHWMAWLCRPSHALISTTAQGIPINQCTRSTMHNVGSKETLHFVPIRIAC